MISIIILTKNEEKNIHDCIESVSWADQIIIVDDYSEDRTIDVVKTYPLGQKIEIYSRKLNEDFSSQRNFAISKASSDWILFLDADERIPMSLREEINMVLIEEKNNERNKGFYIPRKDVMFDKLLKYGEIGNIKLLRMAKKNSGKWQGKVHEQWQINGKVSELENHILHFPHQRIFEFLKEINFYSSIRAKELYEKKTKVSPIDIILYPKGKFILNYILKLGFLDGLEGFIFAIIMSLHSFLVRGKLWLLWQKD